MKILTGRKLKELDSYTIEHEPIRAIDLMERAAKAMANVVFNLFETTTSFFVFAGPGNNGGDALALARILCDNGYDVKVYLFNIGGKISDECAINKKRFETNYKKKFIEVVQQFDPPTLNSSSIVIDGLFGTGINKTLTGGFASLVKYINQSSSRIISLDIPSGLMPEDNTNKVDEHIVKADITISITPKLAHYFAENQKFLGKIIPINIRLSKEFLDRTQTRFEIIEECDVKKMLPFRCNFAHKGNMGSSLIIAGKRGMSGASILTTKACLRSGVGKAYVITPQKNIDIMQMSIPEAIVLPDKDEEVFTEAIATEDYDAMCIGPGLGVLEQTALAVISQIRRTKIPLVIDADAINIFSTHKAWLNQLPRGVILTPHTKELEAISGFQFRGDYDTLMKASELAVRLQGYVILKGHYSALCKPDGNILFNCTGNSGMATAGSGDVLSGIITAFLTRGCGYEESCILGMYIHGLAGDFAAKKLGKESLIASDIIDYLPKAFKHLSK